MRFAIWLMCFFPLVVFAKTEKLVFDDNSINISFDSKQPVTFVGKKSLDVTGQGAAPIMYPGDTAGLFLVSILTHAAVSGGVQKAKLSREQEEANKVLEAYNPYIADINEAFLAQCTNAQGKSAVVDKMQFLLGDQHLENSRWQVNVVPVFAMTQNQSSFLIYNKLTFVDRSLTAKDRKKIKKVKKGQTNPNEKLVVIVSDPVLTDDKAGFWLSENARIFNESIKTLYAESFHLGVARHFGGFQNSDTKQVTIKYLENGVKKIERGYVISQTCKRTLFESLAGEIKSVPNLEFATCGMS
jgi:hypothetical protein